MRVKSGSVTGAKTRNRLVFMWNTVKLGFMWKNGSISPHRDWGQSQLLAAVLTTFQLVRLERVMDTPP